MTRGLRNDRCKPARLVVYFYLCISSTEKGYGQRGRMGFEIGLLRHQKKDLEISYHIICMISCRGESYGGVIN